MNFEEYSYTIAEHFVVAIIYGDNTGLDDEEEHELECFLAQDRFSDGHWGVPEGESYFAHCDILSRYTTASMAQCVDITFWKRG